MRVFLTGLFLSSLLNLYSQTGGEEMNSSLNMFAIYIGDYENFSVLNNGEELDLMRGEMYYDDFGMIETKTANYFPIMITAYKFEKIEQDQFLNSLKNEFRDMFSTIACIEETENLLVLDEDIIVLKANEKLPFMYIVYNAYVFDGMLVDLLKMDIKDKTELMRYLSFLKNIKFYE